jgi:putative spermidine/putrescine transport system substrate-binding protein
MPDHGLTRRGFIWAGAGAALCAPAIVRAEARDIVISGPAGQAKAFQSRIFPILEAKYKVRVLYDSSSSLATLRKMQTQRDNPPFSIAMLDEPVMLDAMRENLLEPLRPAAVPNLGAILPVTVRHDGAYVNLKAPRSAIAYNTKSIPTSITSWGEMWDTKYRKRVMVPNMTRTSAVFLITASAALATGKPFAEAQYDVDAGFKKLGELKPNILTIYADPANIATLLEQGEGWIAGGLFSSYIVARQKAGAPIELAKPREGSFALSGSIAKVRNAALPDIADGIINDFLGEQIQQIMVEEFNDAPAHPKVPLQPGMMALNQMFFTDWEFVAKNRKAWHERFDREIAS